MRSEAGFTFTELLAATTVMAMLAAVAVPRHSMLNSETRSTAVRALATNVRSSAALAHDIWKAAGQPAEMLLDGEDVKIRFGYPTATSIVQIVVMSDEFQVKDGYFKHRQTEAGQGCAVLYIPPPNPNTEATVIDYTEGC